MQTAAAPPASTQGGVATVMRTTIQDRRALVAALVAGALLGLTGGCADKGKLVLEKVEIGEYGAAREVLADGLEPDKANRNYLYERMMLALCELADGLPDAAERTDEQTYEILRTQGINKDKTVASVVINERVRFWKGEPFEQALMFFYIGMQKAMLGEWDNARAAADGSLFLLHDFGVNEKGQRLSTQEIAARAVEKEQDNKDKDYIDNGYTPAKTTFALGYLLNGVANLALDRPEEASDNLHEAAQLRAGLEPVTQRIRAGEFNTILVVDYGLGPSKVAYGMDNVFTRFMQTRGWSSGEEPLNVRVNGESQPGAAVACDVNTMAADHMWNNLEDVRVAKSIVGTALLGAGAGLTALGRNKETRIVGVALMAVGAAAKLSARADTKHCLILPQRTYFVPLTITQPGSTVEVQVGQKAAARAVLPAMNPPREGDIALHYLRLTPTRSVPPPWQISGTVVYANDAYDGDVPGDTLPFILGGTCVKAPSAATLEHYQAAGNLTDVTLVELENLYRAEGICWEIQDFDGPPGKHVLEGGASLLCPQPGSAGFLRLFCQRHKAYKARSDEVRTLQRSLRRPAAVAAAQE